MSAVDVDPVSISSVDQLHRILTSMSQRMDKLEEALDRERSCRIELEEQLEKQNDRYGLILDDILSLKDSIEELRAPTVGSEPPENALPIMRVTWAYRASPETLHPNERRAAVVWSNFFDVCSKTPSKYVLDSKKVGTILTGDGGESPYRQTIRRVMDPVTELGREFVEFRTVDDRSALVIDRALFDEYAEDLSREVDSV